jgi:hypothetical protein
MAKGLAGWLASEGKRAVGGSNQGTIGAYDTGTVPKDGVLLAKGEHIDFFAILDHGYNNNGIYTLPQYRMVSATSGNVVLSAEIFAIAEGVDMTTLSFAAPVSVTDAVQNAANKLNIASIAMADGDEIDNLQGGMMFVLRITRVNSVSDTASGNLILFAVTLEEQ